MATTISNRNHTLTIVHRSTYTAEPSVAAEPLDVMIPSPTQAPEPASVSWFERFRRTNASAPSPRDIVLDHVDASHTIRSIQR